MKIRIGVIPAAGRGMRAYPKNIYMPKVMFEIEGKPIIQRNIEIMRDKLGIKEIYVIINHMRGCIKKYFGDGSKLGVKIIYLRNDIMKDGPLRSIYVTKDYIKEPFIVILGDEVYVDSNHQEIIKFVEKKQKFDVICAVKKTNNPELIKKNYSVDLEKDKIISINEKPKEITNDLLGCGTYVFSPKFFEATREFANKNNGKKLVFMELVGELAKNGNGYAFPLTGEYINVNTIEDLNTANYLIRSKNFSKYKITLIIPALNEGASIANTIKDFKSHKDIDNIVVVDTNSTDKTVEIARSLGAEVITKEKLINRIKSLPGYGDKLRYGLDNAKGDILILTEADGTFRSKDLGKFLEYMKDADMVIGTRTTRQMIEQGANMNWFLRWGNVFVGKFLEMLWWKQEPRFTDVGCTYRAIWKESWLKMRKKISSSGPEFSPEMMIEALKSRLRVIEIPVSYYKRSGGQSKHSSGFKKIKTGLKMIKLISKKRFLE